MKIKAWQWFVLGVIGLSLYNRKEIVSLVGGLRRNNPLNIRETFVDGKPIEWVGRTGAESGFVVFDTLQNGLRAAAMNLVNKQKKHGMKTIAEIITSWSPKNENPTEVYIAKVARDNNIKPNQIIDLAANDQLLLGVIRSMIMFENGINPISNELIISSIKKARVVA